MSAATISEQVTPRALQAVAGQRRTMLDVGRLAAVYAIIWIHAPQLPALEQSKALSRFAVPYFVMVTIFLAFEGIARNPQRSWRQYVSSRFARLYLPLLGWSAIYLAFKAVKGWALPNEPNDYPGVELLWAGSCYHLWFLPFILAVSVLAMAIAKWVAGRPAVAPAMFAVALVAGAVAAIAPISFAVPDSYLELIVNALPAVGWGIALAVACRLLGTGALERPGVALAGGLLAVASIAWVWDFGRDRLVENVAGLGVLLVTLAPVSDARWSRLGRWGPLSLGIYTSHVLWIKILQVATTKAGFSGSWQRDATVFVVSAALSTLTAWTLSRWRWTRWLVA